MESEFAQKNLFITGATSGIGKATALRFAKAGASVAAVGRNVAELKSLEQDLRDLDVRCVTICADLAGIDAVRVDDDSARCGLSENLDEAHDGHGTRGDGDQDPGPGVGGPDPAGPSLLSDPSAPRCP